MSSIGKLVLPLNPEVNTRGFPAASEDQMDRLRSLAWSFLILLLTTQKKKKDLFAEIKKLI
jgi:hypothetical protein